MSDDRELQDVVQQQDTTDGGDRLEKLRSRMSYKLHPTYMVIRTHTINQSDDPTQPLIPQWSVPFEYRTPDMKTTHLGSRNCFFDRKHMLDSQEGQSALERHIQVEEERNQSLFQNPYLLYRVPGQNKISVWSCIALLILHLILSGLILLFDFLEIIFPNGYDFRMFGISSRKFNSLGSGAASSSSSIDSPLHASAGTRVGYFFAILAVTVLGIFCFITTMYSAPDQSTTAAATSADNNSSRSGRMKSFFTKHRDWILRLFTCYLICITLCILVTALFFLNIGLLSFVLLAVQYVLWSASHKTRERCMITYYTTTSF